MQPHPLQLPAQTEFKGNQDDVIPAGMSHVEFYAELGVTLVYQDIPRPRHFVVVASDAKGTPLLNNAKVSGGNYNWAAWK